MQPPSRVQERAQEVAQFLEKILSGEFGLDRRSSGWFAAESDVYQSVLPALQGVQTVAEWEEIERQMESQVQQYRRWVMREGVYVAVAGWLWPSWVEDQVARYWAAHNVLTLMEHGDDWLKLHGRLML